MSSNLYRVLRSRRMMRGFILELSVLSVFTVFTVLAAPETHAAGQLALPVTILQFGAFPGDGQDDTDAMQASADYLSAHPGTTLIYPPGVYNITRIVHWDQEYVSDESQLRGQAVVYSRCHNVKILGIGAVIDVKGDFVKSVSIEHPDPFRNADGTILTANGLPVHYAETFPFNPFLFIDSSNFTLSGFEIRGNVDRTTQADLSVYLVEARGFGVWAHRCHDYVIENLNVHHMITDGIVIGTGLPADSNVTIRRVVCANNDRGALSIIQAKDVLVTNSELRDTGVVGTAPNSYPLHSPGRGCDIEPDSNPENADWLPPNARTPGAHLTGNILFDRVRVTGNLGGGIALVHGNNCANVTVRNSFLQNPIGKGGQVIDMGIAGGVVEDSILDAQNGSINMLIDFPQYAEAQNNSAAYRQYLEELAADPSPVAQSIYRETRGRSAFLRRNTIRGSATILFCSHSLPFIEITDNEFQGAQQPDIATNSRYSIAGYMYVTVGATSFPTDHTWTTDARIERNRIFIPQTAPHGIGYGQTTDILYYGVTRFAGNQYTTNGGGGLPFHVAYDPAGIVVNDRFPTDGSIIPISFPALQPYPLGPGGYLNLPQ